MFVLWTRGWNIKWAGCRINIRHDPKKFSQQGWCKKFKTGSAAWKPDNKCKINIFWSKVVCRIRNSSMGKTDEEGVCKKELRFHFKFVPWTQNPKINIYILLQPSPSVTTSILWGDFFKLFDCTWIQVFLLNQVFLLPYALAILFTARISPFNQPLRQSMHRQLMERLQKNSIKRKYCKINRWIFHF